MNQKESGVWKMVIKTVCRKNTAMFKIQERLQFFFYKEFHLKKNVEVRHCKDTAESTGRQLIKNTCPSWISLFIFLIIVSVGVTCAIMNKVKTVKVS